MSEQVSNSESKPAGDTFKPWGIERRRSARTPLARQVLVYPCKAEGIGRSLRCSMIDQSQTGVGLTCLGRLPVGSHFVLRIDQPVGPPMLQVHHVVRCRDAGGGACQIGAQFDHMFTGVNPAAGMTIEKLAS